DRRAEIAVAQAPQGDQEVAAEAHVADAADGAAGEVQVEGLGADGEEVGVALIAVQTRVRRCLGEAVPGADLLAEVAAEPPALEALGEVAGDDPLVLDREVADAALGQDPAIADRSGGTAHL